MKINQAIKILWTDGFFESHRGVQEVKNELDVRYGIHPSNTTTQLKSCNFLRKEKKGWIQKKRHNIVTSTKTDIPRGLTLQDVTCDNSLIRACKNAYESGNYWDTVFNALRHMEVRVRRRSGLPAADVGADLMEHAFKPNVGSLKIPTCATPGEEDGFKNITKGMMMFHRNAKGHREEKINKTLALKIIGYVDYLLQILDTAEKRECAP